MTSEPAKQMHFLHRLKELADENTRAAKEVEADFRQAYELRKQQNDK